MRIRPLVSHAALVLCGSLLMDSVVSIAHAQPSIDIMPFADVTVGMKGVGRTVFSGTAVDEFDVEVIATMENILPRKNLIIARLRGGPLGETGIMEGMSGSPVFIDGRLVGAVAYSWGFAKEPICGITPIEEMLSMFERGTDLPESAVMSAPPDLARTRAPGDISLLAWPDRIATFLRGYQGPLGPSTTPMAGSLQRMRPTLAFSGFHPEFTTDWFPLFESLSFRPVIAGRAAPAPGMASGDDGAALKPGSSFGVTLVRGDLDVTAIGTVTYAEGGKVLGFGHPFLSMGPTALPMTTAQVHGYLPSLASSFKLASPLEEVGAIIQDRFPGVAGVTGSRVRMVPVRIEINRGESMTSYRFDIVPDPLLTPGLLNVSLLNLMASDEKLVGDITLRLREGSRIQLSDDLDVKLENMFSGEYSALYTSGTIAYMTYLLLNNDDRPARIEGINILMDYEDTRRVARIERIWLERYTARPGETLPLHVELRPFRSERETIEVPLKIPAEAAEGKALLQVGDSLTLSRMESVGGAARFFPRDLEHMVWLLNHIRSNQKVYATLIRPDTGALIAGEPLPNLPPSIASVLLRPGTEPDNTARVKIRALLEASTETPYVIHGYQKAVLEIRR